MLPRGVLVFGAVAVALTLALGATPGAAAAERAHWKMDNRGTPRKAIDSSRFDNDGRNHHIFGNGRSYRFNGSNSRVIVPDARSLDPRRATFTFGVTIRMHRPPRRGETYDVLRKGLWTSERGYYKLEIGRVGDAARARCLVRDADRDIAAIGAPTDLADGARHTIRCTKTSRGVSIRIDRRTRQIKTVDSLDSVSNDNRVGLGAKAERRATTGFDWFRGRLYDAWLRVG